MYNTKSQFSISVFRCRSLAWMILIIFCASFVPSVGLAQQPTATIMSLNGEVQISGQTASAGDLLQAGDAISVKTGASVVLALSDGSELHLGQNTELDMADLSQTSSGARVSRISLLAGWLRAFLSPGHQEEGSSFTVETPNAQVGVRFSQPDVEISYDPAKVETIGIAHTVELLAKNLLTDEEVLVPVGSTVIITGSTIKIITGILTIAEASEAGANKTAKTIEDSMSKLAETEAATQETAVAAGMGKGTMVAIGVGAAAAVGGVVVMASNSEDDNTNDDSSIDSETPFTGQFAIAPSSESDDNGAWINTITMNLTQTETLVTGSMELVATGDVWPGGSSVCILPLNGTAEPASVTLSWPATACERPWGDSTGGVTNCTLENNGDLLRCDGSPIQLDFIRQ